MDVTGTMGGEPSRRGGAAPMDAGLVLVFAEDHAAAPTVVHLRSGAVVLGREPPPPNGIVLQQRAVSRVHAKVSPASGTWVVSDLGSRNGVIVNGERVVEAALAHGDLVRIGDAIFKFVADGATMHEALPLAAPGPHADVGMVGGPAIMRLFAEVERVAKTDLTVLVRGETGTGKEILAGAIHARSARRGKLAALNCAAIPATLVESELFGAKRGAYTGADRDRQGIVSSARGGTLLLDELGDMPLDAQAKLLRMLETKEIVPVGATEPERVDVRVVCATHRDLKALVESGAFRGDLLARINVFAVTLPPLRTRKEDVFRLVRFFLQKHGRPGARVTLRFMIAALEHDWPYNVRELEAAVRRALAVADGSEIDAIHLPEEIGERLRAYDARVTAGRVPMAAPSAPATPSALAPSAEQLRALLAEHEGNVAAVGRALGKDRQQIHRWMRMHGIKPDAFRSGS
jgi:sigma-54 dependent transcriptional regulator, acetoin dehydrogenase operon transcriptional activator AcoR